MLAVTVHTRIRSAGVAVIQLTGGSEYANTVYACIAGTATVVVAANGSVNTGSIHAIIGGAEVAIAAGSDIAANAVCAAIGSAGIAIITIKRIIRALSAKAAVDRACIAIRSTEIVP